MFTSEYYTNNSSYYKAENGILKKDGIEEAESPQAREVHSELIKFINQKGYPCLGAGSVFHNNNYAIGVYNKLASHEAARGLCADIFKFIKENEGCEDKLVSFIAAFNSPEDISEIEFEKLLWEQLKMLLEEDCKYYTWDNTVSANPEDNNFSFSFAGTAFYIIGMHKNSSRTARQFKYPLLIFNLHNQFQRLRTKGKYDKMKNVIREKDIKFSGSVNPMLEDFGSASEAKQYSGRVVEKEWKCPFHKPSQPQN